jgi:hypothetical protein
MSCKVFTYRGYVIQVMAQEFVQGERLSKSLAQLGIGWYSTSVTIQRYSDGKKLAEGPLQAGRLSITPERAIEYGKNFAIRIVDEEIAYSWLTQYNLSHAVSGIRGQAASKHKRMQPI